MEMANIFGGVIDFILDPRTGDEFSILYEEKYLNGEFIGPRRNTRLAFRQSRQSFYRCQVHR